MLQTVVFHPAVADHQIFHVPIQHGDGRRAVLHKQAKLLLPFPQRRLRTLPPCDVFIDRQKVRDFAGGIEDGRVVAHSQ